MKERLFCPNCKEPIDHDIPEGNEHLSIKCKCHKTINLQLSQFNCINCKSNNNLYINEGTQIMEIHLKDAYHCPKIELCDKEKKNNWLKCTESMELNPFEVEVECNKCGILQHIGIIKGSGSSAMLLGGMGLKKANVQQSFLARIGYSGSRLFQKLYAYLGHKHIVIPCNSALNPIHFMEGGKIFACFILGFLGLSWYLFMGWISGYLNQIFWQIWIPASAVVSIASFFTIRLLEEIAIVQGEIEESFETKLQSYYINSMRDESKMFSRKNTLILMLIMLLTGLSGGPFYFIIVEKRIEIITFVDIIGMLGFYFIFALIIQVFVYLGLFIYFLWYITKFRYGHPFKDNILILEPTINRLSEIAIQAVTFMAMAILTNLTLYYKLYLSTPLGIIISSNPFYTSIMPSSYIIAGVILPITIYYQYLGGLVGNLRTLDMKRIDFELLTNKDDKSQTKLLQEKSRIKNTLKWVSNMGLGTRILLTISLLLEYALIVQFKGF